MTRSGNTLQMSITPDATGKEGYIVTRSGVDAVSLVTGAMDDPLGVIVSVAPGGLKVEVQVDGVCRISVGEAGLTAATSDRLMSDLNGQATDFFAGAGNYQIGRMMRASQNFAADDLVEFLVDIHEDLGAGPPPPPAPPQI